MRKCEEKLHIDDSDNFEKRKPLTNPMISVHTYFSFLGVHTYESTILISCVSR